MRSTDHQTNGDYNYFASDFVNNERISYFRRLPFYLISAEIITDACCSPPDSLGSKIRALMISQLRTCKLISNFGLTITKMETVSASETMSVMFLHSGRLILQTGVSSVGRCSHACTICFSLFSIRSRPASVSQTSWGALSTMSQCMRLSVNFVRSLCFFSHSLFFRICSPELMTAKGYLCVVFGGCFRRRAS